MGELNVEGEVTNFSASAAGHWYFSLKDDAAQVSCALFRAGTYASKPLSNGMVVRVVARPTMYKVRGSFQLIVSSYQPSGQGQLLVRLAQLQQRLAAEGLFDASHKQPLPSHTDQIGVITSATGAAITDIVQTCNRRAPATSIAVFPCQVQGDNAADSILSALSLAIEHASCDALIVGRGGGSIEDLMAFNDERVIRAVYACPIPTVSAVGHERDFSLLDLVADVRASTPTAAAEMLTPDWRAWYQQLDELRQRFARALEQRFTAAKHSIERLAPRLVHPQHRIAQTSLQLGHLSERLHAAMEARWIERKNQIETLALQLGYFNPKRALSQGYVLVRSPTGAVMTSKLQAQAERELRITFADGDLYTQVVPEAGDQ